MWSMFGIDLIYFAGSSLCLVMLGTILRVCIQDARQFVFQYVDQGDYIEKFQLYYFNFVAYLTESRQKQTSNSVLIDFPSCC